MDPLQRLIEEEAARRGVAGGKSPFTIDAFSAFGLPSQPQPAAAISPRSQPARSAQEALRMGLRLLPRASAAARIIDAGPVADGTLEHARRMGWVR